MRTRAARPGQAAAGVAPPNSRSDCERGVATVRTDWRRNGGRRGGGGAGRRCSVHRSPGRARACTRGNRLGLSPTWPGIFGPAPKLKVAGGRGRRIIPRRSRAIRGDPQGSQAQTVISRPNYRSNPVPGRSRAPQATRWPRPRRSRAVHTGSGRSRVQTVTSRPPTAPQPVRGGPKRSGVDPARLDVPAEAIQGDPRRSTSIHSPHGQFVAPGRSMAVQAAPTAPPRRSRAIHADPEFSRSVRGPQRPPTRSGAVQSARQASPGGPSRPDGPAEAIQGDPRRSTGPGPRKQRRSRSARREESRSAGVPREQARPPATQPRQRRPPIPAATAAPRPPCGAPERPRARPGGRSLRNRSRNQDQSLCSARTKRSWV